MKQEELLQIYNKFPAVLRSKLIDKEIALPSGTQFAYEKFLAFRAIERKTDDNTPVNKKDMLSHYELAKNPRGRKLDEKNPSSYAASLFKDYADIAMCFKFPNPKKKLAHGYVYAEGGPQCGRATDSHIDWWLYEDVDFCDFRIMEDYDG